MKKDKRIQQILHQITQFAKGDFSTDLNVSEKVDEIDSISAGLNALGEALKLHGSAIKEKDKRMNELLDILLRYTALDFSEKVPISNSRDEIDALGAGLNALGEELAIYSTRLKDSEEQIKIIFHYAPDAVIVIDSKGIIIRWNPAAERIFGWTEKEVMGRFLHEIIIPDQYREKHIAGMNYYLETGEGPVLNKTIELPALCKHHAGVYVELTITPARLKGERIFISFLRDITERKKAEDLIRQMNEDLERRVEEKTKEVIEKENRYRFALDKMIEGIQIIDPHYRYLYVNNAAAKQGEYSVEELQGHTMPEKYPGIENTEMYKTIQRCMQDQKPAYIENEFIFTDNKKKWFELSIQPVPKGLLILSIDITDRKNAEEKILRMNEMLEQKVAERTALLEASNKELESFSYSVSHDLRAPLRAIHGYSQMLMEDYKTTIDEEGKRILMTVQTNAKIMGQLVDDLLEFSRMGKQELKITHVDLDSLVEMVLHGLSQANVASIKTTAHPLGRVRADSALLKQLFENLITNAVKFSSKKENSEIEIGSLEIKGVKTYFVKDNGVGFDMAYYNKLFGVFQRLHEQEEFEGTGVGLAIVHRIVSRHNGKIWAEGKVNEGATFYFTLG